MLSCGRRGHDSRLEYIGDIVSHSPREALQSLDSIDPTSLSERGRAFYNLLSIKAKDKAYIGHTSDSLVVSVINYYSGNRDKELYPEALYYGGRVYSDQGDYPTALRYFQDALDLLPEGTPNLVLRGNVLSQTGRLLNDLGLYQQAIPYIEEVLKINYQLNDTLNLAYDYKLLGAIHLHLKDYEGALENFMTAEKLASRFSNEDMIEDKIHQAVVYYHKDDIKNALRLIRPYVIMTDSLAINFALAYASKIYLRANILDTAYNYARQLTLSQYPENKKTGYMVMLSPELRKFIPKDSLELFYRDYKLILEKEFLQQETNGALIQNSMYNYSVHEKKRQEAERSRTKILIWLIALIAILAILTAIILYLHNKNKSKILALHEAMAKLRILEESFGNKRSDENIEPENFKTDPDSKEDIVPVLSEVPQKIRNQKSLRNELRKRLRELNANSTSPYEPLPQITDSDPYLEAKALLKGNHLIPDKSEIWNGLEDIVSKCFPNLKSTLQLLSDDDLTADDWHIAVLLKCGFSLKDLAILIGRTKGAVTYRRKNLSTKLFGEVLDLELVDNIIRTL